MSSCTSCYLTGNRNKTANIIFMNVNLILKQSKMPVFFFFFFFFCVCVFFFFLFFFFLFFFFYVSEINLLILCWSELDAFRNLHVNT